MEGQNRPAGATYVGKAIVDFNAGVAEFKWQEETAVGHRFAKLEVALYRDETRDRMIVKFKDAAPALQSQAYGRGQGKDVIVEYVSD
jgi:hypothetical protein